MRTVWPIPLVRSETKLLRIPDIGAAFREILAGTTITQSASGGAIQLPASFLYSVPALNLLRFRCKRFSLLRSIAFAIPGSRKPLRGVCPRHGVQSISAWDHHNPAIFFE